MNTVRNERFRRRGVAIWVVICVCSVLFILLFAFVSQRVGVKRQARHSFIALQAQWVAQAAVQHAMLKFRVLPTEGYDASALARGVCPFYVDMAEATPGTVDAGPLEVFRSDVNTDDFPLDGFPDWSYDVVELNALNSFNRGNYRVHVVQIRVQGRVVERLAGEEIEFVDELVKTVDVERALAP